MSPSDGGEGFKVTDRRRRGDDEPATAASAEIIENPDDPTLVGLFMMLGNSAIAAVEREPEQAAELIGVLLLLQRKTAGNRTPEETQVLDDLLSDVQSRYVEATQRSG
jgi:hypothetical protein